MSTQEITRPADRTPSWSRSMGITTFDAPIDPTEGIKAAGLDFEVQKQEMFAGAGLVPNHRAAVRVNKDGTEQILGVVGAKRPVTQWTDHVAFMEALTADEVRMTFAGDVRGGAQVMYGFQLPGGVSIPEIGEELDPYLFFKTSHDSSASQTISTQLLRPFCTNQVNSLLGSALSKVSIRHTAGMKSAWREAQRVLGLAFADLEVAERQIRKSLAVTVSDDQFWGFVEAQFPITPESGPRSTTMAENSRDALMDIWRGTTQENIRGTRWGAEQAFVEYADWFKGADEARGEQTLVGGRDTWKMTVGAQLAGAFPA